MHYSILLVAAVLLPGICSAANVSLKKDLTPPSITTGITCQSSSPQALVIVVADDNEVAYLTVQPKGTFGLTSTVTADPGAQTLYFEFGIDINPDDRSVLLLAADMQGNATKLEVVIPAGSCATG